MLTEMQGDVLVLDHAFRPIGRRSWQEAICDWAAGRVEILAHYAGKIIHAARKLLMPAVVRFTSQPRDTARYYKHAHLPPKLTRNALWSRDRGECQYCAKPLPRYGYTIDHVVPRHRGGPTAWHNVVVACHACNQRKGSRTPDEANMPLSKQPVVPSHTNATDLPAGVIPEPWVPYLSCP